MTSTAADVPTVSDDSDFTAGDGAKAGCRPEAFEEQLIPAEFVELYIAALSNGAMTPQERTLVCRHLRLFANVARDQIHAVCQQLVADFDLSVATAVTGVGANAASETPPAKTENTP